MTKRQLSAPKRRWATTRGSFGDVLAAVSYGQARPRLALANRRRRSIGRRGRFLSGIVIANVLKRTELRFELCVSSRSLGLPQGSEHLQAAPAITPTAPWPGLSVASHRKPVAGTVSLFQLKSGRISAPRLQVPHLVAPHPYDWCGIWPVMSASLSERRQAATPKQTVSNTAVASSNTDKNWLTPDPATRTSRASEHGAPIREKQAR